MTGETLSQKLMVTTKKSRSENTGECPQLNYTARTEKVTFNEINIVVTSSSYLFRYQEAFHA